MFLGKREDVRCFSEDIKINADNLYHFGICARPDVPLPVSNRLRNVPDKGYLMDWELGNVGSTNPESYYIKS